MTSKPEVFPLKLAAFEHYMLADDAMDYPMVIPGQLEFEGALDRERLESSFNQTVSENPLLRAKIAEIGGKLFWIEAELPQIEWNVEPPDLLRIDIRNTAGLRVFINSDSTATEIRFFVHHCVTDGAGLLYFFKRWFSLYDNCSPSNDAPLSAPSNEQQAASKGDRFDEATSLQCLHQRGSFGMTFWKYLLRPFQEICGAIGVMEYFSHRPVAIGAQEDAVEPNGFTKPPESYSHQHQLIEFSVSETQQVLSLAKKIGHTVNNLMLAAMYEACYHWLENHMPEEAHRHLRIMIPMDMRFGAMEPLVGNKVSMTYLDRRPGRYRSLTGILRLVWLEMAAIKRMNLGLTFIHLIKYFLYRNKIDRLLRRDRSVASTILSNMGPLFGGFHLRDEEQYLCLDGIRLKSIDIFPPIRPYTWFTSVVTTYGRQIKLQSTYCSRSLTPKDAEEIQERFKSNLLSGFEESTD